MGGAIGLIWGAIYSAGLISPNIIARGELRLIPTAQWATRIAQIERLVYDALN